ncbi:MAG TPA: hypothetical protein VM557_09315 [Thermoanaerobaculia bacterium]|nr:hypothetical protein [Thermoanaerobaculia bacterium]
MLLPVATYETPGANGSIWVTHFSLLNNAGRVISSPADIRDLRGCLFPICEPVHFQDGGVVEPEFFRTPRGGAPGALIWVRDEIASKVAFSLRVQDISRQALTWGTEIPVVREKDFYRTKIYLHDVPLDSRFRQSLRVYDPLPHTGCRSVRIRFIDQESGAVLLDENVGLMNPDCNQTPGSNWPSSMEWHGLAERAGKNSGRMIVEITPLDSDMAIWAFITVNNNETQHVTTITPQ